MIEEILIARERDNEKIIHKDTTEKKIVDKRTSN